MKKNKLIVLSLFLFMGTMAFSQEQNDTIPAKKNFFQKVWGKELESGITFMPLGYHTNRERNPEIFHDVWYIGANYKSWEITVFRNSYDDPTVGLFYSRAVNFTKKFALNYGFGFIYGYHGRLQHVEGIPLRNTFLIKNELNPVIGFALDYKVAKQWSIHMSFAPQIIIYGVRYTFKKKEEKV